MNDYLPYQQRVINEKKEINDRLEKLYTFLNSETFSSLEKLEQKRLERQAFVMEMYDDILTERINAF
jgi:uncharacterized protein YbaP (TraB family)